MLLVLGVAFVAGSLTILAPCSLPMLPFVLGTTTSGGRARLIGVFSGFATSFVLLTALLASLLAAANVTSSGLRMLSAGILGLAGAGLAIPALGRRLELGVVPLGRLGAGLAPFGAGPNGFSAGSGG